VEDTASGWLAELYLVQGQAVVVPTIPGRVLLSVCYRETLGVVGLILGEAEAEAEQEPQEETLLLTLVPEMAAMVALQHSPEGFMLVEEVVDS
jgi:hypothetical protein